MRARKEIMLAMCLAGSLAVLFGQSAKTETISAAQAKNHIGESETVCGKVVAARITKYLVGSRGRPITFDLDQAAPQRVFSFVAWSPDPAKLEQTRDDYKGKQVCVTGEITNSGAIPHIIVTDPSRIRVVTEENK